MCHAHNFYVYIRTNDHLQDVISRADAELGRLVGDFLHGAGVQFKEARAMAYTFYCRLRDITNKFSASPNIMALFSSPFESTDTTEDDSLIGTEVVKTREAIRSLKFQVEY